MPYDVTKRGSRWCVVKSSDGKTMGCHDTKAKAQRQQRALYAGERKRGEASAGRDTVITMATDTTTPTGNIWFWSPADWNDNITWKPASIGWGYIATNPEWGAEESDERRGFEGVLAVIGHPTADKRYLIPDEIEHRDLPLPFLVQTATEDGHRGAEVAGRIEKITHIPAAEADAEMLSRFNLKDLTDGAVIVYAEGTLDGSDHEEDAVRMIENGAGVSIDMPPTRVAMFDPETLEEIPEADVSFEDMVFGKYLTGIAGKISAATIVSIPAFEEASVMLVEDHALVASAYGFRMKPDALTAAAATKKKRAPLNPPKDWFQTTEFPGPTPLTVTDDGRVFGHLATWDTCHIGIDGVCTQAPPSRTGYAYFHSSGELETAEGELIDIGKLMVSVKHAPLGYGRAEASRHYDDKGRVGAYVRAMDGEYGIWLSGAVRHDLPPELWQELRANRPSGDWREANGNLELVAACAVPVQGFPIPRAEVSLTASAGEITVSSLIASAGEIVPNKTVAEAMKEAGVAVDVPLDEEEIARRKAELAARLAQVTPVVTRARVRRPKRPAA